MASVVFVTRHVHIKCYSNGFPLHKQTKAFWWHAMCHLLLAGIHDLSECAWTWMGQCRCAAKMGAWSVPFQRSMRSFISAEREAENFLECSRQGIHVWEEYCAMETLDVTVWHWLFPLQWESLSDASERTQQTYCFFSQYIMCIEWLLFCPLQHMVLIFLFEAGFVRICIQKSGLQDFRSKLLILSESSSK